MSTATTDTARSAVLKLRVRFIVIILILSAMSVFIVLLALSYGAVSIPIRQVWEILWLHMWSHRSSSSSGDTIIWQIRAPRVALGFLVGAALSLVGVCVQALVRNPIADPYVLGVESGGATAAVIVMYLARVGASTAGFTPTAAAFVGCLATLVAVFGLARKNGRIITTRLLLVGVALSFALSGITQFILYMSPNPAAVQSMSFWTLGGLGGAVWSEIPLATLILIATFVALRFHSRALNALAMGDASATAVGIHPDRTRVRLLIISSLSVAAVIPIAGPIGFVGLVVPHAGRMIFGTEHSKLMPGVALLGGTYLVLVDLVGRYIFAPLDIPLGVMTAILGTPAFLWLLRKQKWGQ